MFQNQYKSRTGAVTQKSPKNPFQVQVAYVVGQQTLLFARHGKRKLEVDFEAEIEAIFLLHTHQKTVLPGSEQKIYHTPNVITKT